MPSIYIHLFGVFCFSVNIMEIHSNNTLKTLAVVHWLIKLAQRRGGEVESVTKFLMKADDDVYINIPSLIADLRNFKYFMEIDR